MHRRAEISDCLNEVTSTSNDSQTHKEMQPGRIKSDNIDFDKVRSWFRSNNPFIYSEHLVCLDCDTSEKTGVLI